jgi:hypothetical protein
VRVRRTGAEAQSAKVTMTRVSGVHDRHGGPRLFVKKRETVRAGAQALRKAARENASTKGKVASLLRYIYTAVGGIAT